MREGGKKTFKKTKTLILFFENVNECDEIKKNIGHISR